MAMTAGTVRASSGVQVNGTWPAQGVVATVDPINPTKISQDIARESTLTYGTAAGKGDLIVCQDRTLATVTAATYDLYTGTDLKDLDGLTAAFRKVKYIGVFIIVGGDAAGVRVGGAASNTWVAFFADVSDKVLIFPSGPPYQGGSPAGVAVGAMTCNLKIENLGAVGVTIRIVIGGSSV